MATGYYQSVVGGKPFISTHYFEDKSTMFRFFNWTDWIKNTIACFNNAVESGEIDRCDYEKALKGWLRKCAEFSETWGIGNVPLDIRWAIRDVQRGLGLEKTDFPDPDPETIQFFG